MYYPDHRHMLAWTTVVRSRMLPEDAIGRTDAVEGQQVNLRDVIAVGTVASRFMFIDAMRLLRLRKAEELDDLVIPEIGELVEEGQVLAGRRPDRGLRVFAPADGIFRYAGDGRIIIQQTPEAVKLEAGLVGSVIQTQPSRGVVIQAYGALIQGVWGNGRRVIGALRPEPDEGLESIFNESLEQRFGGTIVVTNNVLTAFSLTVIEDQSIGGVIAPSMAPALIEQARHLNAAIILTEGFGDIRMSSQTAALLEQFHDRQTTVDAVEPERWGDAQRPEIFINLPSRGDNRPPMPRVGQALRVGESVRLTRRPYPGSVGTITDLPKTPQLLDNGLRVPCARLTLVTGESVLVPLANLEVLGK